MFPNKLYRTIYADPPWPEYGGGKIKRGADRHYSLMSIPEITELPVSNLRHPDGCHLYLWTTNNFLVCALDVMKAWGFNYKTCITWVKDRIGLGQYFRGTTEHCLFGVSKPLPYKEDNGKRCQGTTSFYAPRMRHSEKPETMRKMIELVSWEPYIELFARRPTRGWDVWGNEAESNQTEFLEL